MLDLYTTMTGFKSQPMRKFVKSHFFAEFYHEIATSVVNC